MAPFSLFNPEWRMSDQKAGVVPTPPPGPQTLNVAGQTVRIQQVLTAAGTSNVNLLATGGQQYILTPGQVPGLAQVLSPIGTSTPGGVTRILTHRVLGVPGRGTLQLATTSAGTAAGTPVSLVAIGQSPVNASSYPTLINTLSSPSRRTQPTSSQSTVIPSASPSRTNTTHPLSPSASPQPRKKMRVAASETPVSEDILARRRLIAEHKLERLKAARSKYADLAAELFFLQVGGNMVDYLAWRKRAPTPQFLHFLRSNRLDLDDDDEDLTQSLTPATPGVQSVTVQSPVASTIPQTPSLTSVPASPQVESTVPDVVKIAGTPVPSPAGRSPPRALPTSAGSFSPDRRVPGSPSKLKGQPVPAMRQTPKQTSSQESTPGSQELIVEKAKQEAHVMQRIAELQREGLWTEKRLPKVQEPARAKAHWDYLLEEMVWLAADFAQERKWKKAAAKKCAKMVQKHFHEKQMNAEKAEKLHEVRLRKIANTIAKDIKSFWANIEKLVEFKQTQILEEKRKKALDQQLSFIVDQTEKYSMLLTEGMNRTGAESANNSVNASVAPSVVSYSSDTDTAAKSDDDFQPDMDSEDDERTIAKDEDVGGNPEEIARLQEETEMSLEDLLKEFPGYLDNRDKLIETEDGADGSSKDSVVEDDEESKASEDMEEEEEEDEDDDDDDEDDDEDGDSDDEEEDEDEEDIDDKNEDSKDALDATANESGLGDLYRSESGTDKKTKTEEETGKEINDVAAVAESLQPKGNTLSSTNVVTKIPFLLKHTLREYQHIGLDWLVTMYDRNLNGILADEMGLGKTIQTISLLAHLACEKEDWGPHLIVVPTSVMLNWEMELKKWCPGFKILTYFGSQKERRAKRTGWTKPNAFHVCITSYKLVIQDHQSFRRKKWKYLILDEAQNIKNFKSQRWQLLLNFQTERRLLLTGTPLQNNLMELWSLMHFLMPHVFQSHKEFKEWFSNPVTGMIEGNSEINESIIKRLHKVLRPFLLRRLKCEVEKQLPKKYEHVVMCRLSKRQRYLYDDFMSRTKTKETLASGNLLSVINVLMQLRKVCNHPNLFEARPTISPFQMEGIDYVTASLVCNVLDYDVWKDIDLRNLNMQMIDLEDSVSAFAAHRIRRYRVPGKLIEEIDTQPDPPPPCPRGRLNISIRASSGSQQTLVLNQQNGTTTLGGGGVMIGTSPATLRKPVPVNGQKMAVGHPVGQTPKTTPRSNSETRVTSSSGDFNSSNGNSTNTRSPKNKEAKSQFFIPELVEKRRLRRREKLQFLARCNQIKCDAYPIYGADLVCALHMLGETPCPTAGWSAGYVNCAHESKSYHHPSTYWQRTNALSDLIYTNEDYVNSLQDIFARFVIWVPPVAAPLPILHISHPPPSALWKEQRLVSTLQHEISPRCTLLHPVARSMITQFPDPRLIQYDCGKLQTMDRLLRQLKAEHHRVLIFTQMTRMLDVLEAFLNFHGHIYLRLDGTTRVDQRQVLMERFNTDPRIFCFILSTRSGGVGVNLTGADTVIFYDSDWNPTMDAQAQDRCHRIGQTRDVHIYRLISDKTVEENILKKANQKRMLGNLAIEGGNFTTAFFKSSTIQDLFNVDITENDASRRLEEVVDRDSQSVPSPQDDKVAMGALESALAAAEDETDVIALKSAKAEAVADLEEFDENVPLAEEGTENTQPDQPELSKAEQEVQNLVQQLSAIERYAMTFMEETDSWSAKQLAEAEAEIERQKKDWEMNRLAAAKEEEERRQRLADDEPMLTYSRDDANTQVNSKKIGMRSKRFSAGDDKKEKVDGKKEIIKRKRKLLREESKDNDSESIHSNDSHDMPLNNHNADPTSPRTRSRGSVSINLWTLDRSASPSSLEVPGSPNFQSTVKKRKRGRPRKEDMPGGVNNGSPSKQTMSPLSRFSSPNLMEWLSDNGKELMPMWCPPTPPQHDNDVYIDMSMGFLYDQNIMSESQLPPVYVKKELKRSRQAEVGSAGEREGRRPLKVRPRDESSSQAPRSLFDRPSPALVKMRRDIKLQKYRGLVRSPIPNPLKPQIQQRPVQEPEYMPEWLIYEDFCLFKEVQTTQELMLNLLVVTPAHTPNWDYDSECVTNIGRTFRSAKHCRYRYENVVIPREEGKTPFPDTLTKKQKKLKSINKPLQPTKSNRPMRTAQLHAHDANQSFTSLYLKHFENVREISNKRAPTVKPLLVNPSVKNPKHAAVLQENGIDYDNPLEPQAVAQRRAERIASEKKKMPNAEVVSPGASSVRAVAHSVAGTPTVVSVANLTQAQAAAAVQRYTAAQTTATASSSSPKAVTAGMVTAAGKTLTPQQLQHLQRQQQVQALKRRELQKIYQQQQAAAAAAGTATGTVVSNIAATQQAVSAASVGTIPIVSASGTTTGVGQKVVATASAVPVNVTAVQVSQGQQRTQVQYMTKVSSGKQTLSRPVTEAEMAILIQRKAQAQAQTQAQALAQAQAQGQIQGQASGQIQLSQASTVAAGSNQVATTVAVAKPGGQITQQTIATAQLLAQAGLAVQTGSAGTSQATLVKTLPVTGVIPQLKAQLTPGIKGTQQIRHLTPQQVLLQQRKLPPGQKVTQLTPVKGGVPTQLLVQSPKAVAATMTVQQLQQAIKNSPVAVSSGSAAGQVISQVLAKGQVTGAVNRVIPVASSGQQAVQRQAVQVVAASPATAARTQVVDSSGRPQVSIASTLASALAGNIKVTSASSQQALLSQGQQ
ncbi:Helicase domino [Frankliniella fusca]|uniref:Helicase domino n=1 Tax=Frankliniella fusca TaxID=407009 RepID=A0AAE1H7J4_9NEOP|nr:Helicase domino [Frankliniella fusca]